MSLSSPGRILAPIIYICLSSVFLKAQDTSSATYKETFRPQYHFSPAKGWMNDINGLVYKDGTYHMIYQWGWAVRHGGYATSTDLVHWTDKGVALVPQGSDVFPQSERNVSGQHVFSGSAVVASGKAAKAVTGSPKEAIVAIYTGTSCGTCLAWSNDDGATWYDCKANPVANPCKECDPRDPCVFFHKPSGKYILALYENGTTLYGSDNLVDWEYLSNIPFGFECPDMFELPLDGDPNQMKWVVADANGSYLVGDFDGKIFTPSCQDVQVMTLGHDFYAAQTFPTGGLAKGDDRKIQIAWMDHWNGGLGETQWMRNATFPVTLGLVTYDGKFRLTRTPVDEISKLYKSEKIWDPMTLEQGDKPFEGITSRTFELEAEFDLNETSAESFGFQIANKKVAYHKTSGVFLDEELKPDANGHIKVRLLVDWGSLEAFAAGGVFSYSEQFAFSPDGGGSIGFFARGGCVKLVSMAFHDLASIWE